MCRKAPLWQAAWPAQPHSVVEQGGCIWRSVFALPSRKGGGRRAIAFETPSSLLSAEQGEESGSLVGAFSMSEQGGGPPPPSLLPPGRGEVGRGVDPAPRPGRGLSRSRSSVSRPRAPARRRRCPGRLAGAAKLSLEIFSRGLPGARARAAPPARKPQPRQALGRPLPAAGRKLSLGPWSALRAAREPASFAEAAEGVRHGRAIVVQKQSVRGARARSGSDNPRVFKGLCRLVPARLPILRVGFRPFPSVSVRDSPG